MAGRFVEGALAFADAVAAGERRARTVLAVGLLAVCLVFSHGVVWWAARKGVADRVQTRTIVKFEKAAAKEVVRREKVLRRVQVRFAKDVEEIARLTAERDQLLQEIARASTVHDADVCLAADSVRRLAAIR